MSPNFEKIEKEKSIEKESKILLHFFRHSIKESAPNKQEKDIHITQEGAELAVSRAKEETDLEQSLIFGSPRIRTGETAAYVMMGKKIEETPEVKEVIEDLNKDLKVGSKIGTDERLDFPEDKNSEYSKKAKEAYNKGELMKFIVEESDALAKKYNDEKTYTYSRSAKQIAEIIKKYTKIAPRWNELVSDTSKNYNDSLERFMGTHQSIQESFLAKVIEKTKGIEERNKFLESIDAAGFDYIEGFDVEIKNKGKEDMKVHIRYKKDRDRETVFEFSEEIDSFLLDEIIKEGENK